MRSQSIKRSAGTEAMMVSFRWGRAAAAAAALMAGSAVLMAGCGGASGGGDARGGAASSGAATGGRTASASDAGRPAASAFPGGVPAPLAPARTASEGNGNKYSVAPVTLRRQGQLLLLELDVKVENSRDQDGANLAYMFTSGTSVSFQSVSLVDPAHAKRYAVAKDSSDHCLCTSFFGGMTVRAGQTGVLNAYFAAPPSDVTALDVVVNKVGTFAAVPVSG
jgi:hypothetical protein